MTSNFFLLRTCAAAAMVAASAVTMAQPAPPAVPPTDAAPPMLGVAPPPLRDGAMPPPPAGAMPAPPVAGAMPPPTPGGPLAQAPMSQASASGKLARWLINPNGEADGLLLEDGAQVSFPPHLSPNILAMARPGDRIDINGWSTGAGLVSLRAQSIRANGRSVVDEPPAPGAQLPQPRAMASLESLNVGGRVARVLVNTRGDAHGALLSDGTIVRFPPHVGRMIAGLLQPGAPLYAQGWGTRSPLGTSLEATRLGTSSQSLQEVLSGPVAPARPGPARRPA